MNVQQNPQRPTWQDRIASPAADNIIFTVGIGSISLGAGIAFGLGVGLIVFGIQLAGFTYAKWLMGGGFR